MLEKLEKMGSSVDEGIHVDIMIAPIEVDHLHPLTAAIYTLAEENFNARTIEEQQTLFAGKKSMNRANTGVINEREYQICEKTNNNTARCFLNSFNPRNKFNLPGEFINELKVNVTGNRM